MGEFYAGIFFSGDFFGTSGGGGEDIVIYIFRYLYIRDIPTLNLSNYIFNLITLPLLLALLRLINVLERIGFSGACEPLFDSIALPQNHVAQVKIIYKWIF